MKSEHSLPVQQSPTQNWQKSANVSLEDGKVKLLFLWEKIFCFPDNFLSIDVKKGEFGGFII